MTRLIYYLLMVFITIECGGKPKIYSIEKEKNISSIEEVQKSIDTAFSAENCKTICMKMPDFIKREILTKNEVIHIIITNNSANKIIMGDDYRIEKFDNNQWTDLKLNAFFNSIGYQVHPYQKLVIEMKPYFIRNIGAGKYRLTKSVLILPEKSTEYISDEFVVTD